MSPDTSPTVTAQANSNSEGAAIHPTFLRVGPWALSVVVAVLFGLSFATSYAALYDYARKLQFSREFALAFPLVLDAVIVVLAITLLLERALGRRTVTVKGRHVGLRLPTWPLLALWLYFAGSVAGNIGHAPPVLAAQLVASAPPVSAALTFHLLLRLLDRATLLRAIAEGYEERSVEQKERAALRKARRAAIKSGSATGLESGPGGGRPYASNKRLTADGPYRPPQFSLVPAPAAERVSSRKRKPTGSADARVQLAELRDRVQEALEAGERVTGDTVGQWLDVSPRTGRRRLAGLLDDEPALADAISTD